MSARIGEIHRGDGRVLSYVHASLGGVEMTSDEKFSMEPVEARNAAALIVRAADEVERIRRRDHPGLFPDAPGLTPSAPPIYLGQRVVVDAGSQKGQAGAVHGIMRWLGTPDMHYVLLDNGKVECAPYVRPEAK